MAWYERTTLVFIRPLSDSEDPTSIPDPEPVHLRVWQIAPAMEIDRLGGELARRMDDAAKPEWQQARKELIRR